MSGIRSSVTACRDAVVAIAALDSGAKAALLRDMGSALEARCADLLAANAQDMAQAAAKGVQGAMLDRLRLDAARVASIANALREVAALPDPVGQVTRREKRPNGLEVERVRIPLGVVAMIYEARPNVTADAAALCLKAGNAVVLRGGSEAIHSNTAIAAALHDALRAHGLPTAAVTLVEDLRRETMVELLQLSDLVDLAIPRGGEGLIRFVAEHARVPVIKHYKGVCHLYVDRAADLELALDLLVDGKTSRPGVCNALETLLVHREVADEFLPRAAQA
ncbi:MAG: glutamate-5-semialdehyde dehydrogenase, partial [Xanthomonadaceae bacterium]|nr:glutamate-5-semialdehyde dehydrogenase [Xanthomonadaceae bacterium]